MPKSSRVILAAALPLLVVVAALAPHPAGAGPVRGTGTRPAARSCWPRVAA